MKKTSASTHKEEEVSEIDRMLVGARLRRTRERVLVLSVMVRVHTPCSVEMLQGEVGGAVNKVTLY
ncbi:MAG: hypothetical protein KBD21_05140, partial [Candidatus Pacebacteria bacterium]|nr:hypothetical protein [Candidatus Paceibacterota bacterium]